MCGYVCVYIDSPGFRGRGGGRGRRMVFTRQERGRDDAFSNVTQVTT